MRLEQEIAQLLRQSKQTLSVAESCSGGLLAHRITNIPGSSDFFRLGVVTYSNTAKSQLLKVPAKIIKTHGAVSDETAQWMAKGVRKLGKTNFGVGITGIAGPSGGTKQKPVGLTFIAVNTPLETLCLKCLFRGTRQSIKTQAATQALNLLLEFLD